MKNLFKNLMLVASLLAPASAFAADCPCGEGCKCEACECGADCPCDEGGCGAQCGCHDEN